VMFKGNEITRRYSDFTFHNSIEAGRTIELFSRDELK
jgi:hypothetical protein